MEGLLMFKIRMELLSGILPANSKVLSRTLPANSKLLSGTLPANNKLLSGPKKSPTPFSVAPKVPEFCPEVEGNLVP